MTCSLVQKVSTEHVFRKIRILLITLTNLKNIKSNLFGKMRFVWQKDIKNIDIIYEVLKLCAS